MQSDYRNLPETLGSLIQQDEAVGYFEVIQNMSVCQTNLWKKMTKVSEGWKYLLFRIEGCRILVFVNRNCGSCETFLGDAKDLHQPICEKCWELSKIILNINFFCFTKIPQKDRVTVAEPVFTHITIQVTSSHQEIKK